MKLTYDEWKKQVNELVLKATHGMLDTDSLPDWDYYSAYRNGMSTSVAAKAVIRNAKEY